MLPRQDEYKECDTIFYQGANCTQTQALHYTGSQKIVATTGEIMWSEGRNSLKPLNVIYNLHIGTEIQDVNLNSYSSYFDYVNPLKRAYSGLVKFKHYYGGVQIMPATNPTAESVTFHTPNLAKVSYGQASDITSHQNKYQSWLERKDKKDSLILWGVSRGTAATFSAFATHHYPEVKLVVLEGAIDSMENIVKNHISKRLPSPAIATWVEEKVHGVVSYLTDHGLFGYKRNSISPLSRVDDFPENIPVVFITSKLDGTVPAENTENIANALARRGKNDVYLLMLQKSSHPCYMYDDKKDRDTYEAFIHAIYEKYGLQHDAELAEKGKKYLDMCLLPRGPREEKQHGLPLMVSQHFP